MQLRTVPDIERGCGRLKEGGCYAKGDMSSSGTLNAWSWCLGQHLISGVNLAVSVPARQMQVISLPGTLGLRRFNTERVDLSAMKDDHPFHKLPPVALIDHIGSEYYTPWLFQQECVAHGPSRRIPQNIAKAIAPHTPIPIVFTHSWMPIADKSIVGNLIGWADEPRDTDDYFFGITCERPGWGLRVGDYKGQDHWIIPILRKMHEASDGKEKHLTKLMPPELAENTLIAEQILGISWITRVVYIATDDDNEQTLEEFLQAGIEPVRLEDDSED